MRQLSEFSSMVNGGLNCQADTKNRQIHMENASWNSCSSIVTPKKIESTSFGGMTILNWQNSKISILIYFDSHHQPDQNSKDPTFLYVLGGMTIFIFHPSHCSKDGPLANDPILAEKSSLLCGKKCKKYTEQSWELWERIVNHHAWFKVFHQTFDRLSSTLW